MKNIFHRSAEFVQKHKKHHHLALATLALLIAGTGTYIYRNEIVQASTYTFSQTSWTGGADTVTTAVHATNQSGWTKYNSLTTATAGAGGVALPGTNYSFVDDGATSTTPTLATAGGTFGAGTNSSTAVTGSGTAASVGLYTAGLVNPGFTATGGTITTAGGYNIHTFTSSGTFAVSAGSGNVEYLVVAGGGGGGPSNDGGGAGGLLSGTSSSLPVGNYAITVGAGGAGSGSGNGVSGQNSLFSTIATAIGGGGGGSYNGVAGGSGGGGAGSGLTTQRPGGAGTAGQGNAGGTGNLVPSNYCGGSGGGAGAAGNGCPSAGVGANGGIGISSAISGVATYYAGGGAGGYSPAAGGLGGGGGSGSGASCNATANTGGGGGSCAASGMAGGNGGSGIVILRYFTPVGYPASGIFTSAVIDTGAKSAFTTFAYSTTLNGQTITMDVRAGNTATPDGTWTVWTTGVLSGGSIAAFAGNRYIQYRANLSTTNPGATPTLDSVTINYTQYALSGDLTSSVYDTQDATNLISKLTWTSTGTTADEIIKFQVRSSADGVTWSNWCGYADTGATCTGTNYFLSTDSGVTLASGSPLRSNNNDRYLQYKAYLISSGDFTPTLTGVTAQYVVNAPPAFDSTYGTNGIVVSQDTSSASATFGKVAISYKVRDTDTTTGTTNPGFITPSFEYSTNGGTSWAAIPAGALATGDTSNKAVGGTLYTTYTATWTATSTAPSLTILNAKVRITANDNEAANSTGVATSANFTLDTTAPAVVASFDSSTGGTSAGTVYITATDSNTIQYRVCNDSTFPTTDAQGNSCAWSVLGANLASTTVAWVPMGVPSTETVYTEVRDLYGNVTANTLVTPAMLSNFITTDTTNLNAGIYREFLSWGVAASSTFGSYKVYSNTTGVASAYSLLGTVTTQSQNYYTDTITTATTSVHYYKVVTVSANGDVSEFSPVKSDVPDGSGSTDLNPPYIPLAGIAVSSIRNNSANITFSTYTDISLAIGKLSTSTVRYASYTGTAPTSCPSSSSSFVSTNTYTVNHSIYLTGLTPTTNYVFCVFGKDVSGNLGTATLVSASGGTFTTSGGPVITNVTEREITDISALVFWNTTTSADSYVSYSTSASLASPLTAGSGTLVATPGTDGVYQHQVGLTGLTAGRTYYFKVTSTDGAANSSTSDNSGQYYSFVTLSDTTPPVVSGIATPVISSNALVVVWQTDEPATSQVLYDVATTGRSRFVSTDTTKSIYHVVTLSSATTNAGAAGGTNALTPSTPYFYVVKSADAAGNTTTSPEQTVTTPSSGTVTIVAVSVTAAPTTPGAIPDTIPPTISGVAVSDITPFGATVKFGTSEDAVGFIRYGKDIAYSDTAGDDLWGTLHTIKFHGLTLGTPYHFLVRAVDKAGNTGVDTDQTFTTKFLAEGLNAAKVDNVEAFQKEIEAAIESILPSLVPPFISKPQIIDIAETSAKVSFKTNIKAFPVVVYADDGSYDEKKDNPYIGEVSDTLEKTVEHTLSLTGLKSNMKYHIQARAFSLPKVIGKSPDLTFTTKASKIQGSIVERKKDSFTVVWTTDLPTSSIVEFKNAKSGITERKTDDALRTSHSMKVENLPSGTTYDVNISGLNEKGNISEGGSALSVTTSRDVTPPEISGFKVDNALVPGRTDRIQTIISWSTDEPSNSTVFYEEGAGVAGDTKELANKNEVLNSYVTAHSVILPNLKPGTIYRLKVTSSDDSGNESIFGPRTVITPRQTESITDIIFKNFEDSFKFLRKI